MSNSKSKAATGEPLNRTFAGDPCRFVLRGPAPKSLTPLESSNLCPKSKLPGTHSKFKCTNCRGKRHKFKFHCEPCQAFSFRPCTRKNCIPGITGRLTTNYEQTLARTSRASYACPPERGRWARNLSWEFRLRLPRRLFYCWRAPAARNPNRIDEFYRAAPCS